MSDLLQAILEHGEQISEECAIIDAHGRRITYGTLAHRIRGTAGGLLANGFEPGDTMLFSIRPGPDALVLALAVVAAGGTVAFADPGVGSDLFIARAELANTRWAAAESLLYAGAGFSATRAYARRRGLLLPDFSRLEVRHLYSGPWLPGVPQGALSLRQLNAPFDDARIEPDAPAVVVFTSGTTAKPRGVVHTRKTLTAGVEMFHQRCALRSGHIVHTDQLMLGLPALVGGACWSLPGTPLKPERFGRQLADRQPTHVFLVPGDASRVLDTTSCWNGVKTVLLGAAPVAPALLRRIQTAVPGGEVLSIYGMTEVAPLTFVTADEKLAHTGEGDLVGTPPTGISFATTNDELVVVQAPHLCQRYLGEPALTELPTGDLGRVDASGRVVLLGRCKDMIIRGEHNIYPGLYEPRVAALPGVLDAVLLGVPRLNSGEEEVVLAMVLESGISLRKIRQQLGDVIPGSAFPDRVVVIPEVPRRGRTSKPDREALRCALR